MSSLWPLYITITLCTLQKLDSFASPWNREGSEFRCGRATVILVRLDHFHRTGDAQYCAGHFRCPQCQPLKKFGVLRNEVKVFLVQALGSQVVLVIGNAFRNID
jgi:hypothetical protein